MIDTSETVVRRWPGFFKAGIVLHLTCGHSFADPQSRAGRLRPSSLLYALVLVFTMMELRANTTIYVGKHFEVRDHDQPTKYVFNGSTRVARITGSLSTNTRIQRFRLRPGWNLLSLAVTATNALRQLTNSQFSILNSQSVVRWDQTTLTWLGIPPNETLPAGTVLWVNATTNTTLVLTGIYANPVNRQIAAGTTYLATTGLEAWSPNFPLTLAAWSFDTLNSQPTWHPRLTGALSSINELHRTFAPGQALYTINQAPFELEVPDPGLRIRYYHQDHLGSSSVMTDANGSLVEEAAFYPFGIPRHEHRLRPIEEAYKFTQKERDRESGLHYFEARYLVGSRSRFLSVDPKYSNAESPESDSQALNLYAYVRNNPLQYTDPTGLQPDLSAIRDLALRQKDDDDGGLMESWVGMSMEIMQVGATVSVGFCDHAFGCGNGGYQVTRPIVVEGYNVDTDSTLYKGSALAGTITSMFIPSPVKAPPAAPGTVTLFAKTPVAAPMAMARPPAPGTRPSMSTSGGTPPTGTNPPDFGHVPTRPQATPLGGDAPPTSVRGWHPRQIPRESVRSNVPGGNAAQGEVITPSQILDAINRL